MSLKTLIVALALLLSIAAGSWAEDPAVQAPRTPLTCFASSKNPGGEKIVLLVGSLQGLHGAYIDATYAILAGLLKRGYTGCVGVSDAPTWRAVWQDKTARNLIFLGHGLDGDLSTSSELFISPESLLKKDELKLLMMIACQSLKKQGRWVSAAPNAVIVGSDENLPIVAAPLLSALTVRLLDYSKTLPRGGDVLKMDDPRTFLGTTKRELSRSQVFPGKEFLDGVFQRLLKENR